MYSVRLPKCSLLYGKRNIIENQDGQGCILYVLGRTFFDAPII